MAYGMEVDRIARADAGDLQAGLDLISLEAAETALAQRSCVSHPDRSVLDFLRDPGQGTPHYQSASVVLEELAGRTEETASDALFVYRYIQAHSLWNDHPDPNVRSADDLDYIRANIAIGTSARALKRKRVLLIDTAWGHGWFARIPAAVRKPEWIQAEDCSLGVLTEMAANAKQGISGDMAVDRWRSAIHDRTDFGRRRELQIKTPITPYLVLSDVASLNQVTEDKDKGRRTTDVFFPDEAGDERLKLEVVPNAPAAAPTTVPTPIAKPDYSAGNRPRPSRKRKSVSKVADEALGQSDEDEGEDANGWRRTADGEAMIKRVRNHLVRRPIEDADRADHDETPTTRSSPQATNSNQRYASSQLLHEASHSPSPRQPTCDGPAVALVLRKLIDAFEDVRSYDGDSDMAHKCCDRCRPQTLRALHYLRDMLLPCARALERIKDHRFDREEVRPSQVTDISPHKNGGRREQSPLFVQDSSDVD
ncbi:hypothetical protein LTR09_012782 [Extremus antarcticus]|uniref:Uncharacterized protein n=1 Tax=Extremus antarcticus TaxID=702011 RepID=A0AAJ0D4B5_9PEZI|nr:hypothetical protein LTR09_012782 [Extremus antarcticus]